MKKQNILIGILLVAGAFTSCKQESPEEEFTTHAGKEVVLNIGILPTTRTITTDKKTLFVNGDRLGIFELKRGATDVIQKNLNYQYMEGKWSSDHSLTFPLNGDDVNFYAYYPYMADCAGTAFDYSVSKDQSAEGGYNQNDLLLAKNESVSASETSATLQFTHQLALVEVTTILPEGAVCVKAELKARISASVDLIKQTAVVKADAATEYVTMEKVGDTFRAVVPSQALTQGKFIRLTTADGMMYWYQVGVGVTLAVNTVSSFEVNCN